MLDLTPSYNYSMVEMTCKFMIYSASIAYVYDINAINAIINNIKATNTFIKDYYHQHHQGREIIQ